MNKHTESDESERQRSLVDPYHHTFNPETEPPSEELVRAMAAFTNSDPTELPVLTGIIDPDALDNLFRDYIDDRSRETDRRIDFEYNGHQVRITDDGTITIRPIG